jgi:hypothetical protein
VEQSHYRFKRAVGQALSLRGTRDFATRDEYAEFLRKLLQRRNGLRRERLATELAVLRPLPALRLEDYSVEMVKVTRNSTITVRHNLYSVPSQLIGERVEVRVFASNCKFGLAVVG